MTWVGKEFTKRRKCREQSFHSLSKKRRKGMVWGDTRALRGGGFELLLDHNRIKKGRGVAAVWLLGRSVL